jgi:hypothetical protein
MFFSVRVALQGRMLQNCDAEQETGAHNGELWLAGSTGSRMLPHAKTVRMVLGVRW